MTERLLKTGFYRYGSLRNDLLAADVELRAAEAAGDMLAQQRACIFALAAVQRSFPFGEEYKSLARVMYGLQRVTDGVSDEIFRPVSPGNYRPTPERYLEGVAVAFVRMFGMAGMKRGDSFVLVSKLFSEAGMTSHGGGGQADSDHSGISRQVTPNTIKALWSHSRPGKRLMHVGEYGDKTIELLRARGAPMETVEDVKRLFKEVKGDLVDLLTTPRRSDTSLP